MKRKLLAVLLSAMMLLTYIPLGAVNVSAEEFTQGAYTYTVTDGEATITKYNGAGGAVVTPTNLGGYPVTAIAGGAFCNNPYITTVEISDGVTAIGEYAFAESSLTSAVIPDSVTVLGTDPSQTGYGIFARCRKLTSVTIGKGLSEISAEMFIACEALTSIEIPENIQTIGWWAFAGCGLKSIVIPDSVKVIGEQAFDGCTSLEQVTLPKSITRIDMSAFLGCTALTTFNIPEGLLYIGMQAFSGCTNLKSLNIPASLKVIGYMAFDGCVSLTDVYYAGTEMDRANIGVEDVDDGNAAPLLNATWHYNCINPKDHYSANVQHSVMDTDNGNGLAFKFELAASVGIKGQNKVNFTNATINYLGEECKLVGMGAVITNQENVTLDLGNVNGKTVIDISTVYLTDWEPDSCAFAARVINIPNSALERVVYARPYYIVEVDGEQIVVYGDIDFASCAEYM